MPNKDKLLKAAKMAEKQAKEAEAAREAEETAAPKKKKNILRVYHAQNASDGGRRKKTEGVRKQRPVGARVAPEKQGAEQVQASARSEAEELKTAVSAAKAEAMKESNESGISNPLQQTELLTTTDFISKIPRSIHQTQENFDFVVLYDQWRNGHLRLRCQSIMSSLVVHSNGDVPLCQNRDIMLGNIHRQSLDDIFNSMRSCHTQCHHSKNCNGCWINFHRKYDIILLRNLERLFPKRLIEKFYGSYQWTDDPHTTYHRYFKNL